VTELKRGKAYIVNGEPVFVLDVQHKRYAIERNGWIGHLHEDEIESVAEARCLILPDYVQETAVSETVMAITGDLGLSDATRKALAQAAQGVMDEGIRDREQRIDDLVGRLEQTEEQRHALRDHINRSEVCSLSEQVEQIAREIDIIPAVYPRDTADMVIEELKRRRHG
jgi:hypothetical protein